MSTRNARRRQCAPRFTRLLGEPLEPRLALTLTPQLLADINTAGLSVAPRPPIVGMGSVAYFSGDDFSGPNPTGRELWRSDGTQTGTYLLKDIRPSGSSDPVQLTVVGNTLCFSAIDESHGRELWKSDGTAAGTKLVKDINAGAGGSLIVSSSLDIPMIDVNGTLFFKATDGVQGTGLWNRAIAPC